jgi:hypothetical protein
MYKMKTKILIITITSLIIAGCYSGQKKQRLEIKEKQTIPSVINRNLDKSVIMETVEPANGIKFRDSRKADPNEPPAVLRFADDLATKDLNLSDYFSKVRYVKLKYPYPEEGNFLDDATVQISEGDRNYSSKSTSEIFLSSNNIVAGDNYMGYHCYDLSGKFMYTVASPEKLLSYNKTGNTVSFPISKFTRSINRFFVIGDNCLIYTLKDSQGMMYFHNLSSDKTYLRRPANIQGTLQMASSESYIVYQYFPFSMNKIQPFMYSFDIKGDTLCGFNDANPRPTRRNQRYYSPDAFRTYIYNGLLTLRQHYSDTIFRLASSSELKPAYIMNFGKYKLHIDSAFYGDKQGRLLPNKFLEAKDFVFIANTEDMDIPYTRSRGLVKYSYYFYDKNSRTLYRIPAQVFPEEYWLGNSVGDGIPLYLNTVKSDEKAMYASYTKSKLEALMKHESFPTLSAAQQDKIKSLHDSLGTDELLVMILE